MYKRTVALLALVCLFQGYHFAARQEVIDEYQPILIEKANNFSTHYTTATTETTILETQIHTTINSTITLMNTQITTLKSTVTTAKNMSADNANALACIAIQEAAANKLTSTAINTTCWAEASFTDLEAARANYKVLATIANSTISACGMLDPLPSQEELFESCVVDKVLDLDEQLQLIAGDFETVKSETLNATVSCLADASASVGSQISEINYQVTICLTLA